MVSIENLIAKTVGLQAIDCCGREILARHQVPGSPDLGRLAVAERLAVHCSLQPSCYLAIFQVDSRQSWLDLLGIPAMEEEACLAKAGKCRHRSAGRLRHPLVQHS